MPKNNNSAKRYRRIHEIFSRRRGGDAVVKLQDLADTLGISLRQLNVDIKYLREEGAPLEYVPALRGWRYAEGRDFAMVDDQLLTDDDVLNIRIAIETFNKINNQEKVFGDLPGIFRKIYRASRKWTQPDTHQKYIYFDPLPRYDGGKHLKFFLTAIEESHRVEFQYLAFHAQAPKTVLFDPWFLRHYDRRWYVGGFSHDAQEGFVRTFPLERIVGEPVHNGYFHDKPPQYNAETYWKNIYGITVPPGGQVEAIVLELTPIQGRYFLSTPFFEPFELLEQTPQRVVVRFRLRVNIDLIRKIGSFGADARVLAPEWLVQHMREFFQKALQAALLSE